MLKKRTYRDGRANHMGFYKLPSVKPVASEHTAARLYLDRK